MKWHLCTLADDPSHQASGRNGIGSRGSSQQAFLYSSKRGRAARLLKQ